MAVEKPATIPAYIDWLRKEQGIDVSGSLRQNYRSVANVVRTELETSDFWKALLAEFREFDGEYLVKTSYPLFATEPRPALETKPFDSFLLKTFRRNVINNSRWPDAPDGGWLVPPEWFGRVKDLVRTYLVVKYMDGIKFASEHLVTFAEQADLQASVNFEARAEGYYAAHVYVTRSYEIPKLTWDTVTVEIPAEIQIISQLQDVLTRLTHPHYERRRARFAEPAEKWQWDYDSDEFVPNYLGHVLHYVEGMIMQVRERKEGNR
ncbi:MAG TPA: hypothetical protein VFH00_01595 [Candidatus Nitrosotalea sp.]|nr:hypothetical protein [Candidatus Nitrosotalea sp.]